VRRCRTQSSSETADTSARPASARTVGSRISRCPGAPPGCAECRWSDGNEINRPRDDGRHVRLLPQCPPAPSAAAGAMPDRLHDRRLNLRPLQISDRGQRLRLGAQLLNLLIRQLRDRLLIWLYKGRPLGLFRIRRARPCLLGPQAEQAGNLRGETTVAVFLAICSGSSTTRCRRIVESGLPLRRGFLEAVVARYSAVHRRYFRALSVRQAQPASDDCSTRMARSRRARGRWCRDWSRPSFLEL